jgi:hypothetical protein
VPQQLRILQSLWAMERRLANEGEWPLGRQLEMIRDAGYDGAGVRFIDPAFATEVTSILRAHGLIWQAQRYPTSVDDLKPVLELAAAWRRPCQPAAERAALSAAGMHSLSRGMAQARG